MTVCEFTHPHPEHPCGTKTALMAETVLPRTPWRTWHLVTPREPRVEVSECGHPDHQALLRQLGEALGLDMPALPLTPEVVWEGLLREVERRCTR